jgi:hypothetical protein
MSAPIDSPWITDVRVRERQIKSGRLDPKELEKHLRELPDMADKAENLDIPQPALESEESDEPEDDLQKVSEARVATANDKKHDGEEHPELPGIDFTTFVVSLSHSALADLGDAPQPDGRTERHLPLARHTIDLLGLLQDKTKGNLSGEEERMLSQVLHDLRMRYVEVSRSSS